MLHDVVLREAFRRRCKSFESIAASTRPPPLPPGTHTYIQPQPFAMLTFPQNRVFVLHIRLVVEFVMGGN